jgi:hypothetical protein
MPLYEAIPTQVTDGAEKKMLGDDVGRPRVIVDGTTLSPDAPSYTTAGVTGYEADQSLVSAVPRVLERVMVGIPDPSPTAVPIYVLLFDSAAPVAAGAVAVVPGFKLTVAGALANWEPVGGVRFAAGIQVALSSTPKVFTAVVGAQLSTTCWTKDP